MSTTAAERTAAAEPPAETGGPERPHAGHRKAIAALARIEAVRLLRHPLVLAAAALSAYLLVRIGMADEPILNSADIGTQWPLVPLAAATMVAVNLAVLRPRRCDAEELYATVPLGPAGRTMAHLISVVPVAAAACALVGADIVWLATRPYAAGSPNPAELATGPALVLVFGAVGVLLGRVAPSVAAGPLTLVGLLAGSLLATDFRLLTGPKLWLGVFFPVRSFDTAMPEGIVDRPAGWHLAYLASIAVALAAAALWRSGMGRTGQVVVAGAVVLTVAAAAMQLTTAPHSAHGKRQLVAAKAALKHSCQRLEGIDYCAYTGYLSRVALWRPVVQAVRAQLPATVAARPLTVRQQMRAWEPDPSETGGSFMPSAGWSGGLVEVGMNWPRGSAARQAELHLAIRTAAEALRLPKLAGRESGKLDATGWPAMEFCRPAAGGGVALWLAAQARPGLAAALRSEYRTVREQVRAAGGASGDMYHLDHVLWRTAEIDQALALLDRPPAQVRALIERNWTLLTTRGRALAEVATAFKLPAPQGSGPGVNKAC
jgi:hypothetical protein